VGTGRDSAQFVVAAIGTVNFGELV
jgi:hypothetical protein